LSLRIAGNGGNSLNQALVDAHLVAVPGLGALTAGGLAGGDGQVTAGQADGALDAQVLALGAVDQLAADLLEGLDLAGGEGDADLVGCGTGTASLVTSSTEEEWEQQQQQEEEGEVTGRGDGSRVTRVNSLLGASPKSFSGLLYDILTDWLLERSLVVLDCWHPHDLNGVRQSDEGERLVGLVVGEAIANFLRGIYFFL